MHSFEYKNLVLDSEIYIGNKPACCQEAKCQMQLEMSSAPITGSDSEQIQAEDKRLGEYKKGEMPMGRTKRFGGL